MTTRQLSLLEVGGWTVTCEAPLEISDKDGNYARGKAANLILYYLELENDDIDDYLSPCPFCGSSADLLPQANGWYMVRCNDCCASIKVLTKFPETAIIMWNRRV